MIHGFAAEDQLLKLRRTIIPYSENNNMAERPAKRKLDQLLKKAATGQRQQQASRTTMATSKSKASSSYTSDPSPSAETKALDLLIKALVPIPPPPPTSDELQATSTVKIAKQILDAMRLKWSISSNEFNAKLRQLSFNLPRNEMVRKKALGGQITASELLTMNSEDLQTEQEKVIEREKVEKVLMGPRIVLSEALFDDDVDEKKDQGAKKKCSGCGSNRILMSRRQSYNEQSTWCGEEDGAPMMINCMACGKVASERDE